MREMGEITRALASHRLRVEGGMRFFPLESVVASFGPAPLAVPPRAAHRAAHLNRLFHVGGRFRHEVEYCVFRADHAVALDLPPGGWPARHQRLIVRLLLVTQLDVEQAQLAALRSCQPALEQVPRFGRRTGHKRRARAIYYWYSQGISLSPGRVRGTMTLPDGPSGLRGGCYPSRQLRRG